MPSALISNAAQELLARNVSRKSFIISNEDSSIEAFIKREQNATLSASTTDHDHRIPAGGSIALSTFVDGDEAVKDRWTIIAASGTPRVSWFETEDVMR